MRRRRMMALFLSLCLIAVACAGGEAETAIGGVAESVDAAEVGVAEDEDEPVGDDSKPVIQEGVTLEAETQYQSESTGVPINFSFSAGAWQVGPNGPGHLIVEDPDSLGFGDKMIAFIRPSALSDPTQPGADPEIQDSHPLNDIIGWVDGLAEGVTASEPEMEMFGGQEALRFTVQVTDSDLCGGAEEFCVGFVTNNFVVGWPLEIGSTSTVYWIDFDDDLAPLVAIVGSRESDDTWRESADALLATVELGEPEPHPVSPSDNPFWERGLSTGEPVPAGLQRFPSFGGVQLDLDEDRVVNQPGSYFLVVTSDDGQGDVEIWRAFQGPGGETIESTDDLVLVLEQISSSVEEVGSSTYPLGEAREFDIRGEGNTFDPGMSIVPEPGVNWFTPSAAHLWVFETERGIVVVSAESFLGDLLLDDMRDFAETVVLPSAEFINFG